MIKQDVHIIKGMTRDYAVSRFNPEFAFDNQNIRITAKENTTLLSVTNEKGNKAIQDSTNSDITFQGTAIGYCVLNNYLILFTVDSNTSYIYRIYKSESFFVSSVLYSGNLGFNTDYPLETIGVYENENIQKVYWVDGLNQPRVINITAPSDIQSSWNDNSFNFVQELKLNETISVVRDNNSNGVFSPGVIQYAFTYYNLYGQESNIFNTTNINYITYDSRGGSPEETVSNSFKIAILNPDLRFDYIRIYSIHRTSINSTPTVRRVVDIALDEALSYSYTDNGTTGETIDPTSLLYIGGREIVAGTMAQKDNTLFLGDIKLKDSLVDDTIVNSATGLTVSQSMYQNSNLNSVKGTYSYTNSMGKETNSFNTPLAGFKYGETYRIGLQFQRKNGSWSEAVFVKDVEITEHPEIRGSVDNMRVWRSNITISLTSSIISTAVSQGFIRVRGVVVLPTEADRTIVCQGILCPTVFNIEDRFSNSPYVQSSWFSRPDPPCPLSNSDYTALIDNNRLNSLGASVSNDYNSTYDLPLPLYGQWAEFRHNYHLPFNTERNCEIQCMNDMTISGDYSLNGTSKWVAENKEVFATDRSIVTLHSPDIEFNDSISNMDSSNLKLRIVGVVPITGNSSDIDIETSTPQLQYPDSINLTYGFYKEGATNNNLSMNAWKNLISGPYWYDFAFNPDPKAAIFEPDNIAYVIYPWHRNGSLNNQNNTDESNPTKSALLSHKRISNLKYSAKTAYLSSPWYAYVSGSSTNTGISGVQIFNSNEVTNLRIPAPENSDLGDFNYYGNIDRIITMSRITEDKVDGYPIMVTGVSTDSPNVIDTHIKESAHDVFVKNDYSPIEDLRVWEKMAGVYITRECKVTDTVWGTDPISMKYKSTPHAVFTFNFTTNGRQRILPTAYNSQNNELETVLFDQLRSITASQDTITPPTSQNIFNVGSSSYLGFGHFWLGELYRDEVTNRFGGTGQSAYENNIWLPAGNPTTLINSSGEPLSGTTVYLTAGDTFFQRYDCLKTYPFTLEDQNSITEIVSFMCETRVNIDGRYDKNRGQTNNFYVTPTNFNLINPVYTQQNNFFNYRGMNYKRYSLDYFPNTITWSTEKQMGADTDAWTNITMASTLDLDGDKGKVVSLNTFNNEIFCFQETGLSNILFNNRVQIPTSDSTPIEITNGMKVDGKRYISNTIGCSNKWSIVETPTGLYFADDITNSIYLFNGSITSLSDSLGFREWVNSNVTDAAWNPIGFNNIVSCYDKNNGDVYFITKNTALVYSEMLKQFTSFMSYEKVPFMFNIGSDFFSIRDNKIWRQFAGEYNMFYNVYKPYSITVISNPDEPYDKIFNNLEWRADCWQGGNLISSNTFDTLEVWNEYQKGITSLVNTIDRPSSLKKKFRVWRANIPRANVDWNGVIANGRDRIRNTWAYIKLARNTENTDRMEFHDMIVHYFV